MSTSMGEHSTKREWSTSDILAATEDSTVPLEIILVPGADVGIDPYQLASVTSTDNLGESSQKKLSAGLPKSSRHVKGKKKEVDTSQAHSSPPSTSSSQVRHLLDSVPRQALCPSDSPLYEHTSTPSNPIPYKPTFTSATQISDEGTSAPPENTSNEGIYSPPSPVSNGDTPPPPPNTMSTEGTSAPPTNTSNEGIYAPPSPVSNGYTPPLPPSTMSTEGAASCIFDEEFQRAWFTLIAIIAAAAIALNQVASTKGNKFLRASNRTAQISFIMSFLFAIIGFSCICILHKCANVRNHNQGNFSHHTLKVSILVATTGFMCLGIFMILVMNIGQAFM